MQVATIIKAAELVVTLATAALLAVENWDALAVAVPGIIGLAIAGRHYRNISSARGRGSGKRL